MEDPAEGSNRQPGTDRDTCTCTPTRTRGLLKPHPLGNFEYRCIHMNAARSPISLTNAGNSFGRANRNTLHLDCILISAVQHLNMFYILLLSHNYRVCVCVCVRSPFHVNTTAAISSLTSVGLMGTFFDVLKQLFPQKCSSCPPSQIYH